MLYILNMSNCANSTINLPIFKQGDDIQQCIQYDANHKIDTKISIQNYIDLLQIAIDVLTTIKNNLPDDNDFEISGDTHYINLSGNRQTLEYLESLGHVSIDEPDEPDEDDENHNHNNENHENNEYYNDDD